MIRFTAKTIILTVCAMFIIGTVSAQTDQDRLRERVARGKKVGVQKVIKSADPDLIYAEGLKYYNREKWKQAGDLFDASAKYFVGNIQEDSISFFAARCKFKQRDYSKATVELDEFRRKFGRSIFIEDAEAMLAMCHYYLSPDPSRDQTITAEAIASFSEFIERYPNSKRTETFANLITELTERLKKKAYLNAYTYYKIQRYNSAIVALRNALKTYPETPYREKILYLIAASNYEVAHNSIEEKKGERYLKVLDSYYSFFNEYPESKYCKELERYTKEAKDYLDKNNIEKQK